MGCSRFCVGAGRAHAGEGATMTNTKWTDRSRVESYQRCQRLRFLSYHEQGIGLEPARQSLPLAVGLAVHVGLETLLTDAQMAGDKPDLIGYMSEDKAVAAALSDFARSEEHTSELQS